MFLKWKINEIGCLFSSLGGKSNTIRFPKKKIDFPPYIVYDKISLVSSRILFN